MKFIFGLGNSSPEYYFTRHNFGFMFLDFLSNKLNVKFSKGNNSFYFYYHHNKMPFYAIKPDTWMNLSGNVVKLWVEKYNIHPSQLLIVYDDVDIPFGKIKIKKKGGAAGHNGIASIINTLKVENIPRLRLGIGPRPPNHQLTNFVLSKWSDYEKKILPEILLNAFNALLTILDCGIEKAMSLYN